MTSAERTLGAPRVLMMALALAGQVAVLSGDDSAPVPVVRLLEILQDKGLTYWADEALALAALILVDRLPEEAAVVINASRALREALDNTGSQIRAMRERLRQCHHQLVEALGPQQWQEAEQLGRAVPTGEAVVRALGALAARPP